LAADDTTRKAFKPEGLCTEVTQLLADMRDNLNALKYAVHIFSIQEINQLLLLMRNLDFDLKREYEEFMNELGSIADKLEETENKNIQEHDFLVSVAKSRINGFQNDLRKSINKMRKAKQSIISIM
jgi:Asp-tRNA(Asn)/Glu-tRNA(Gln) amidotransferase C subunit